MNVGSQQECTIFDVARLVAKVVGFKGEINTDATKPDGTPRKLMYVRLAFAVAAHLEPDVLIVDEVLAVGDMDFQKKCLGKMNEIGQKGRTVIFVSHNMSAIHQLCSKGILLANGSLTMYMHTAI